MHCFSTSMSPVLSMVVVEGSRAGKLQAEEAAATQPEVTIFSPFYPNFHCYQEKSCIVLKISVGSRNPFATIPLF